MKQSRGWAIAIALVGCLALGLTSWINYRQGHTLAVGQENADIQAYTALIVDAMGGVFAVGTVFLWRAQHRVFSCVVCVVCALCVAYSFTNVFGFGAANRIAKTDMAHRKEQMQREAIERAREQQLAQRNSALEWMKETYAKGDKGEKKNAIDGVTALATRPVDVIQAPVIDIQPDAQTDVISQYLGISQRSTQAIMIAWVAVLLKVGEVVCFAMASAMWPRKSEHAQSDVVLVQNSTGGFEEYQRVAKSAQGMESALLHSTEPGKTPRARSTAKLPDEQFSMKMEWTEDAAWRWYEVLDKGTRDGLSTSHLGRTWHVHRNTAQKWRRQFDKVLAAREEQHTPPALRVVTGGGQA